MKYKWGDLITLEYGKPVTDKERTDGMYPVFGTNGQIGTTDLRPLCNHPSFILGRKGAYRGVHYSATPFSVIDTAFYAENLHPELLDIKWAYYKFLTYDINSMDSGSAIPSTDRYEIYSIEVEVPDLKVQKQIVKILECFDTKIKLNIHMTKVLEEMAQALFKHWFVDFEFPNEEGKPYRSSGGKMVESEMGMIPEGWSLKNIGDVVKIVGGNTPSTTNPEYWDGGVHPFCTPKDLASLKSPILLDTERHLTTSGVQKISSKQLPAGTLLLSSRAPIGYTAISAVPLSINQGFIALPCDENISNVYMLHWLQENMDEIKGRANGSTFLEISKTNFRSIPFLVPDTTVLSAYNDIVKPYYQLIENATKESERLEEIRDALLPKLMGGEISLDSQVINTEKVVG